MLRKLLHTLALLLFVSTAAFAQSPLDTLAMRAIMVNQLFPQERVYLHFDNTAYYLGETMWFKAYTTSGLPTTRNRRAACSMWNYAPPKAM